MCVKENGNVGMTLSIGLENAQGSTASDAKEWNCLEGDRLSLKYPLLFTGDKIWN